MLIISARTTRVGALTPHTPQLAAVLKVFAVWVLLDGLAVVPRAFFERELAIGSLVAPEIWRGLAVAVVSVGLAFAGWGYWSFVAGDLAGASALGPGPASTSPATHHAGRAMPGCDLAWP